MTSTTIFKVAVVTGGHSLRFQEDIAKKLRGVFLLA